MTNKTEKEQQLTFNFDEEEIWKPIEGYEGLYEISNLGRVKSLEREVKTRGNGRHLFVKERILKDKDNGFGYRMVQLHKNGKKERCYIHRLVARAFLENPNKLPYINHKDENPSNNRVENLEWCTAKYNANYGSRIERITRAKSKKVLQYDKQGNFVKEWVSINEIQRQLGYATSNISSCCKRNKKHTHAYGFIWKYKNEVS